MDQSIPRIHSVSPNACIHSVSSSSSAEGHAEKPQGLSVNTEQAEVTVIPDRPRDSQTSDSDSDGPILYPSEDDEEEDEYTNSMSLPYSAVLEIYWISVWEVVSVRWNLPQKTERHTPLTLSWRPYQPLTSLPLSHIFMKALWPERFADETPSTSNWGTDPVRGSWRRRTFCRAAPKQKDMSSASK